MDVKSLREKYPIFEYQNYEISEDDENIIIRFEFEILGLTKFNPETKILKKNFNWKNIKTKKINDIVFALGMVEAISYFKATCSPQFIIKCGNLNEVQKAWFNKLFYAGLGEFRYVNGIDISEEEFVKFISDEKTIVENNLEDKNAIELQNSTFEETKVLQSKSSGIIIPVGGGKDSNVTLELLNKYKEDTLCFRIGVNEVSLKCAEIAGFPREKVIEVTRTIDKNILILNEKGFLNGHTPFSAMVAFLTYLTANLLGKKYIALSNEDSANQSNVDGENINHQYSKSFEFEKDIRFYFEQFLSSDVEYFSILRPITELQIAMLFSKQKQYHKTFKSCNVGSKQKPWVWCCNCPKCLFVFSILSPFLYKDENIEIFGEDLFEKESLKETFIELCGFGKAKPFECVGTYEEVRFAISKTIKKLEKQGKKLPYLLEFYKNNYELVDGEFLKFYNKNNFLPEEFDKILKDEIEKFEISDF